jgi:hypothetical protein
MRLELLQGPSIGSMERRICQDNRRIGSSGATGLSRFHEIKYPCARNTSFLLSCTAAMQLMVVLPPLRVDMMLGFKCVAGWSICGLYAAVYDIVLHARTTLMQFLEYSDLGIDLESFERCVLLHNFWSTYSTYCYMSSLVGGAFVSVA